MRTRLHALWLLRRGEGPTAVAAALGVSRNAVQTWQRWYREGGLPRAVASAGRSGQTLLPDGGAAGGAGGGGGQGGVRDGAGGAGLAGGAVRGGLAVGSLYTLLPRLGIRLKTPRPRHPNADPQAQAAWKKYRLAEAGLTAGQGVVGATSCAWGCRPGVPGLGAAGDGRVAQMGWKYTYVAVAIDPLRAGCGGRGRTA